MIDTLIVNEAIDEWIQLIDCSNVDEVINRQRELESTIIQFSNEVEATHQAYIFLDKEVTIDCMMVLRDCVQVYELLHKYDNIGSLVESISLFTDIEKKLKDYSITRNNHLRLSHIKYLLNEKIRRDINTLIESGHYIHYLYEEAFPIGPVNPDKKQWAMREALIDILQFVYYKSDLD